MSWLPQRWRTQRNAIRHANCRIQWVIKTLNATCTSLWGVCLLECLFIPITYLLVVKDRLVRRSRRRLCYTTHTSATDDNNTLGVSQETLSSLVLINEKTIIVLFFGRKTDERRDVMKKHTSFIFMKSETAPFRSDLQSVKITRWI